MSEAGPTHFFVLPAVCVKRVPVRVSSPPEAGRRATKAEWLDLLELLEEEKTAHSLQVSLLRIRIRFHPYLFRLYLADPDQVSSTSFQAISSGSGSGFIHIFSGYIKCCESASGSSRIQIFGLLGSVSGSGIIFYKKPFRHNIRFSVQIFFLKVVKLIPGYKYNKNKKKSQKSFRSLVVY